MLHEEIHDEFVGFQVEQLSPDARPGVVPETPRVHALQQRAGRADEERPLVLAHLLEGQAPEVKPVGQEEERLPARDLVDRPPQRDVRVSVADAVPVRMVPPAAEAAG